MSASQVMKMMGLNNAVHWVAWFITGFVQLSISVTALTAILKYGKVLMHSDVLIIWLFLAVYAVATIMFWSVARLPQWAQGPPAVPGPWPWGEGAGSPVVRTGGGSPQPSDLRGAFITSTPTESVWGIPWWGGILGWVLEGSSILGRSSSALSFPIRGWCWVQSAPPGCRVTSALQWG